MFDREEIARAAALRAAWEAGELHAFLERRPESRSEYQTLSGLPLKRVYTAEDTAGLRHEDLGLPGQYPYTRGPYPTMYRGRLWTMRQIAGFGTGEDTNGRFRYLIEQGQTGLSVDFDMPTLMGYDSDDPDSPGHVRRPRPEPRLRPQPALGHGPGGHPQGVHRSEGVDLPDPAV